MRLIYNILYRLSGRLNSYLWSKLYSHRTKRGGE